MKMCWRQLVFNTQASRDIALAAVVSILVSMVLVAFNINERFIAAASRHEQWQVDELPLVLLVAYAALTWFSVRRWNESRQEVTARLEAEQKIAQLLAENQRLLRHSLEVQEEEKRSLARELHDELGQYLHAARTESVALRLGSADKFIGERAKSIEHALTHIQLVARDIISKLRPPALDELGLSAALEQLVLRQCETSADLQCSFNIAREVDVVDGQVAINAYRIAQECLTNIVRHAHASKVNFMARLVQNYLILEISDNGRGHPVPMVAGFGIAGIRERVDGLDGKLTMHSEPGHGVFISVSLPFNKAL
jgi:signal transduction histidine kinase